MSETTEIILNSALEILVKDGNQRLSMRKIAQRAGISLSNVQYYYKNKELLLASLLERFLNEYSNTLNEINYAKSEGSRKELKAFLSSVLTDIDKDNCGKIFKEIWVIAEENKAVRESLDQYYKNLKKMLFDTLVIFAPESSSKKQIINAVEILLPFIEGYCITKNSLSLSPEKMSDILSIIIFNQKN